MSYTASSALWDMASLRFTKMSLIASHILLYPSGTLRKPLTLSSTRKSFVVSSIGAKKISWLTGPCTLCIDRAKGRTAMRFRGKVALISGAGSGIGRATAQMIGAEDGTVVGVDLDQTAIEQIMDGIRRAGGKAHGLVANALEVADVARVVQQTIAAYGRIDILVNAVGGSTII